MNRLWTRDYALLNIATFLMFVAFYLLIPTLPVYLVDELQEDKGSVGLIIAAFTLAAIISRPFAGYMLDKWGRSKVFLFAMIFFSVGFIAYGFVNSLTIFLLLRFYHGFTWGFTTTSSATGVVDILPELRRGEGIGYYGMSLTLAMAIGPLIGVNLSQTWNYQLMFNIGLIIAIIALVIVSLVRFPPLHNKKSRMKIRDLFSKPSLPVALGSYFVTIIYGGIISFIALLANNKGIDNSGSFFTSFAVGLGLFRLAGGKVFDKYGPNKLIYFGILCLILGIPLLSLYEMLWIFIFSAFLIGSGHGLLIPTFQVMVNNLEPASKRGAANSTFLTSFDLGVGSGSIIIGYLAETIGLEMAFLSCVIYAILALFSMIFFGLPYYHKNNLLKISSIE